MALDFPASPTIGNEFTGGGFTWTWTGAAWEKLASSSAYTNFDFSTSSYTASLPSGLYFVDSIVESSDIVAISSNATQLRNSKLIRNNSSSITFTQKTLSGSWTTQSFPVAGISLKRFFFYNNTYYAIGQGFEVFSSSNGTTWTQIKSATSSVSIMDVVVGPDRVIAVGGSVSGFNVWSSTNPASWSDLGAVTTGTGRAITYGNGMYMAVGDSGRVVVSTDGVSWSTRSSGTGNGLYGVAAGLGGFAIVQPNGSGFLVTDGNTFTTVGSNSGMNSIAFGNNTFVAVGNSGTITTLSGNLSGNGGVVSSRGNAFVTSTLNHVVFGNGYFVGTAENGAVGIVGDGVAFSGISYSSVSNACAGFANNTFFIGGSSSALRVPRNSTSRIILSIESRGAVTS